MVAPVRAALLCLFPMIAVGCTTVTRFRADFENEPVGPLPWESYPSGSPNGDRISNLSADVPGNAVAVTAAAPVHGARSLRLSAVEDDIYVLLWPVKFANPQSLARAIWSQRLSSNGDVKLTFYADLYKTLIQLHFQGSQVSVNGTSLGTCPTNATQQVIFSVNPANDQFSLSIGTCQLSYTGPIQNPDLFPDSEGVLGVSIILTQPSSFFYMDDISIAERP